MTQLCFGIPLNKTDIHINIIQNIDNLLLTCMLAHLVLSYCHYGKICPQILANIQC